MNWKNIIKKDTCDNFASTKCLKNLKLTKPNRHKFKCINNTTKDKCDTFECTFYKEQGNTLDKLIVDIPNHWKER